MSLNVLFNGSNYIIPETGEVGWGGNTTSYLVAIAAGALQKTGGSFTLSAETDFGASFGLKSLYYKSRSSNIATSGIIRLNNNSDAISWRNAANSADLSLFPNASNLLTFNGSTVYVLNAGTITNADISPSAGIVYSKLNLSNAIVNADINTSAAIDYSKLNVPSGAIAYSKLTLTNSVVNADINSSAAIAFTKMAAMTVSRMTVSDASGFLTPSAWGYNATADLTTGPNDELRFQDSSGGDYVSIAAPASVTTHGYLLPIAAGTAGQVLSWQAGGQLQWINAAGGGTINTGTAGYFSYYPSTGTTLDDQSLLFTDLTNLTLTSGQWLVPTGTVALPSYSFTGDPNTGIYNSAADEIAFSTGGGQRGYWRNGGLVIETGDLQFSTSNTGHIYNNDGTSLLPGYSFVLDSDTGIHRSAANTMQLITTGTAWWQLGSTGTLSVLTTNTTNRILNSDGTDSVPSYSFDTDTDSGMTRISADRIGIGVGGIRILDLATTRLEVFNVPIHVGNGTASAPSYSFSVDSDTGVYRSAADTLSITTAGTERTRINSTRFTVFDTDFGVEKSLSGGIVTGYIYNGSNTASSDTLVLSQVAGTSAGDPMIGWSIPAGTIPEWRMGSDNSAGDVLTLSRGTALGTNNVFTVDGSSILTFTNPVYFPDGSASVPSITFGSDTNTGLYRPSADDLYVSTGGNIAARFRGSSVSLHSAGSEVFTVEATRCIPVPDNSIKLGDSAQRWTTVYATNGTINTSHSSTKANIVDLDVDSLEIPRGVEFDRDGRRYIGYLNDSLPDIARPDGDKTGNYENAVIGILCAKLQLALKRITDLEKKILGE